VPPKSWLTHFAVQTVCIAVAGGAGGETAPPAPRAGLPDGTARIDHHFALMEIAMPEVPQPLPVRMMHAFLCLVFAAASACSQDSPGETASSDDHGAMYGIVTNDNSAVRIDPLIYASRVTLLRKGEKVRITDQSKEKSWVGKSSDYWYKIGQEGGITGWIFGGNIKRFKGDRRSTIESYVSNLREEEEKEIRKELTGKWWSVNSRGDFSNHAIELYEDGKYKSYQKGGSEIEGEYTINFTKNEIVFLKNTSFGLNLKYIHMGTLYYLETVENDKVVRFKKISNEPSSTDEGESSAEEVKKEDGGTDIKNQ
jgi:hypothetical protein